MSCGSGPGHSSPACPRYLPISRSISHLQKQGRVEQAEELLMQSEA